MNNAYNIGLKEGYAGIIGGYPDCYSTVYVAGWIAGWYQRTGKLIG